MVIQIEIKRTSILIVKDNFLDFLKYYDYPFFRQNERSYNKNRLYLHKLKSQSETASLQGG